VQHTFDFITKYAKFLTVVILVCTYKTSKSKHKPSISTYNKHFTVCSQDC